MSVRISSHAKKILIAGAILFASSFYPNYVANSEFWGDVLELAGTTLLVLGSCIVITAISESPYVVRFLYAGCIGLVAARALDFTAELPIFYGMPLIGKRGAGTGASIWVLEGAGYTCALLSMLAVLRELFYTKTAAQEEHRRYKSLYEESFLLARVADMSAEAVFGCDCEGVVRTWNLGAQTLFGYTRAEALGNSLADILPDGPQPIDAAFIERILQDRSILDVEAVGRTKVGRQFPAEASFSIVSDDHGEPVGISVVVRDIAKRKQAEQELIASRNLLAGALHAADVGMFIVRSDLQIVEFNARMEELTGERRDTITSLAELARARFNPSVRFADRIRENVFERRSSVEFRNLSITRQDGSIRICNVAVSPIVGEGGQVVGAGGIALDITDREALQAKLLEAQKLESVGRLAGGVAHDFNNLLGGIMGYASLMRQKLEADSPYLRYVESIEDSANRASELTHQLLAFARGTESQVRAVQINDILYDTVQLLERSLDPNIRVITEPSDDLPTIEADPSHMKQMLMNLLINARDAIGESGLIRVSTKAVTVDADLRRRLDLERPGAYVRLDVEDNGCGMPQGVCDRIFEPYFSTKEKGRAYGLGLSVVYGIVHAHGGAMTVQSELGEGSQFQIYLPALGAPAAAPAERPASAPRRTVAGTETVLVVDDEKLIRTLVQDILTAEGYTVLSAASGEEALGIFEQRRAEIDLVLLDLVMPGIGGARTLERLRAIAPDLRCIISSGYGVDSVAPHHLTDSHVRVVAKPYLARALAANVRELLDT
ncbi:MAG: PAS domain S-box protein [Candidatus Hydrogenedentes bacterium]|nr:PAS domain S-box protein [Candidatus Hydrogenedentota bacterium]